MVTVKCEYLPAEVQRSALFGASLCGLEHRQCPSPEGVLSGFSMLSREVTRG